MLSLVKQAAEHPDVSLVSLDWLHESIRARSKVDEKSYIMTESDPTMTGKDGDKGKKRTCDGSIKKESSENDEANVLSAAKKQKDDQKTNSMVLTIPLDEGCSLAS